MSVQNNRQNYNFVTTFYSLSFWTKDWETDSELNGSKHSPEFNILSVSS